ncbi:AraC family transcriptional regulator [Paenibacillus eucommiae]|uniref:AraC-like DNA-binding protein n=1 Tax=Paenibacillus eucommiae TaxID=1355755 RepID=A0ABS4IN54_9BACL|nr:AraC family transcriptional regulator [Paenibacillus eucommiae]MBP1988600.1 AraC-like DNA-binding protein [Paenibacillus eucommiae]
MELEIYRLKEDLQIQGIFTLYYMELPKHFIVNGEEHNFWELVYVDKGEVIIYNGKKLRQGDMIFYKPNEFHIANSSNETAPNLVVITFECQSPSINFFADKVFVLNEIERGLLSNLVKEGMQAFDPPIDSPFISQPSRCEEAPFGSEQLIKNYLEILLIQLIRRGDSRPSNARPVSFVEETKDQELTTQIIAYMNNNLSQVLSLELLCSEFVIGRTRLKTAFKAKTGLGVMEYFNMLKIEKAKLLIREGKHNFTEVAAELGYSSVHYFSRNFKKVTHMTLTEYTCSISARAKRDR